VSLKHFKKFSWILDFSKNVLFSFVFSIPKIVCHLENPENAEETVQFSNLPIGKLVASEKHHIHSLAFHKDFLIVGTVGAITGYLWNTKTHTVLKTAW
jgi:hypothetical protein